MKKLNKTFLSLAIALGLATTAVATDEVRKEIQIKSENGPIVQVFIDDNGNANSFELSKEALSDKNVLRDELASLDEKTRESIMSALENVHVSGFEHDGDHKFKIFRKHVETLGGEDKVIVLDMDEDVDVEWIAGESAGKVAKKVIEKLKSENKFIEDGKHKFSYSFGGGLNAESLASMLKNAKLSQEDLDKLQAVLDSKR